MPGMSSPTSALHASGMPGMDMPTGNGLSATSAGFTFVPAATTANAGAPVDFRFTITGPDGKPVTAFQPDQTQLMHFYLIRDDLSGFQHVHGTMAADGTWTAPLAALQPGSYRTYASFITTDAAGKAVPLVLSAPVTVAGDATPVTLPEPATTTEVEGYTVTLDTAQLMSGMSHPLTVTISRDGKPVTDLQPYLDTYAHLTAFRRDDLAFAHLHPGDAVNGDHGGPTLKFEAELPQPGQWRLFLQFRTGGVLHTAAITVAAS
ncbi:hypothetical protein EBN03_22700 [Nocardia stercoris]|uniref:Heavy-metal-associated domain-containing protein n=2 Tax=Nocardia stercoris TaxID=2483361 RepID=A0A3M2KXD0_9NOCA|nr:hypothetical protein EBN03_22700 [Nocardia stercoris]